MIIGVTSGVGAEEGVGGVGGSVIPLSGCGEIESVVGFSQLDGIASIDIDRSIRNNTAVNFSINGQFVDGDGVGIGM